MKPAGSNILIVDDEQNLRATLAAILGRAGHRVTAAADAREALDYLNDSAFDLAFVDLRMPGMDGLELLGELRCRTPRLPVLILTAHASLESAIEAVSKGARDYLIKPADPETILKRVQELLEESAAQDWSAAETRQLAGDEGRSQLPAAFQDGGGRSHPSAARLPRDAQRFLRHGPLHIDRFTRQVIANGQPVVLSPLCFEYLMTLIRYAPRPVSCETLLQETEGAIPGNSLVATNGGSHLSAAREQVEWHIQHLLHLIEPDPDHPQYILPDQEGGYRLAA